MPIRRIEVEDLEPDDTFEWFTAIEGANVRQRHRDTVHSVEYATRCGYPTPVVETTYKRGPHSGQPVVMVLTTDAPHNYRYFPPKFVMLRLDDE